MTLREELIRDLQQMRDDDKLDTNDDAYFLLRVVKEQSAMYSNVIETALKIMRKDYLKRFDAEQELVNLKEAKEK